MTRILLCSTHSWPGCEDLAEFRRFARNHDHDAPGPDFARDYAWADFVIVHEPDRNPAVYGDLLMNGQKPSAIWLCDTSGRYNRNKVLAIPHDVVFVERQCALAYRAFRDHVYWAPPCAAVAPIGSAEQAIASSDRARPVEVGVVDDIPFATRRSVRAMIDAVRASFGDRAALFSEYDGGLDDFCRHCRLVLVAPEINGTQPVLFDALAAGACVITGPTPELPFLFEAGRHLLVGRDLEEMIALASRYLDRAEDRVRLARAGYTWTHQAHTLRARVQSILDLMTRPAPLWHCIGQGPISGALSDFSAQARQEALTTLERVRRFLRQNATQARGRAAADFALLRRLADSLETLHREETPPAP